MSWVAGMNPVCAALGPSSSAQTLDQYPQILGS